jgi:hypothetical protein
MSMAEQHTAILGELAQLGLSSARDLHARQLAAETPEQASRLAFALHRISRSLRQTLALQAKLARDARLAEREAAAELIQIDQRRLAKRKAQVKAAVECLIWTEAESPEAYETFNAELEDLLTIETQDAETFESEPLDAQIKRLCDVIGLPSPLAGEGGLRSRSEEGSHNDRHRPSPTDPDSPAQPLIRPASAGHLLPQGEKDDDLFSDDYWRSSG